jgi:hypothetical protein
MLAEPAYYLLINDGTHGPYTAEQIRVLIESQSIQANLNSVSFAIAGSSNWQPISEFSALMASPANTVFATRPGIGMRLKEKVENKSHTLPLAISGTCLWLIGLFLGSLNHLVYETAAGVGARRFAPPRLTSIEIKAISFISMGWEMPAFLFCLLVASLVANKADPFSETLFPALRSFSNRLIAARRQVNLTCCWVVRLTIICAVLLVLLWPCSTLAYFFMIGSRYREPVVAAVFGEDTTISTTLDGIRIFAPNELLDLLRRRLDQNYSGYLPPFEGTRFTNVKFNHNNEDPDTYEQWVFDIELRGNRREHVFLHGNARRDRVDNRRTPWDLILEERPHK